MAPSASLFDESVIGTSSARGHHDGASPADAGSQLKSLLGVKDTTPAEIQMTPVPVLNTPDVNEDFQAML